MDVAYRGAIKRFAIGGDDEKASIQIVIDVPLTEKNLQTLTTLGAMKRHGKVDVRLSNEQAELPLDDAPEQTPMDAYFDAQADATEDASPGEPLALDVPAEEREPAEIAF